MARQPRHADNRTARLALAFVDLRAHFEAQLRTVLRAERCLLKCSGAHDANTFDRAVNTLRAEVQTVAANRRNAKELVKLIVADAQGMAFVK